MAKYERSEVQDPLQNDLDAASNSLKNAAAIQTEVSHTDSKNITLTVPGDFSTVSNALTELSGRRTPAGVTYTVEIADGHEFQEPVSLVQADLRNANVVQESNSTISLASGFPSGEPALSLDKGSVIRWQTTLDGGGHNAEGYYVQSGSIFLVSTTTGATGFTRGVQCERSFLFGANSDFSSNSERGLSIVRGSLAQVQGITARLNGDFNVRIGGNSVVQVTDADLTDSNQDGLRANNGSTVYAEGTDVSGASRHGLSVANGARVSGHGGAGMTINNCGGDAVDIGFARVDLRGASIDGAGGSGVRADGGGLVDLRGASISNATDFGIFSSSARIDAAGVSVSGSAGTGVSVRDLGSVSVVGGSVTGSVGDDLVIRSGSFIAADDCETTDSTGTDPHQNDVNKAFNQVTGFGIPMSESFET
jgi:hypothetical protein